MPNHSTSHPQLTPPVARSAQGQRTLARPWPVWMRALVVLGLYGGYFLLGGGLQGERMPYDAGHYWELAVGFQRQHQSFSLLNFHDPTRGYLAALLQFPALVVRFLTHCSMPTAAKVAGTGWATLLFAFLIPELWRSVSGRQVSGGRWLLLVLLAFSFWRDFFSFTTTDMPALALLLLALWAVSRAGIGWWLVAGLSLAASLNSRPMYLAAVLPALLLAGWYSKQHREITWVRWLAVGLGVGVALAPQLAINRLHFNSNSPLVLARVSSQQTTPLYLKQLTWGTRVLRYDTNLHQRLIYADSAGLAVLHQEGVREYTSYGQFLRIALHHPFNYGWRYVRHLFNGLDVWQPAPYPLQEYSPARFWVQLLNYTALGVGLSVLLLARPARWLSWPRAWVLLALLLPCLIAIPTAMETRFLLPLHLLLLAGAAFRFSPRQTLMRWRLPWQRLAIVTVAGLWLSGCFWLSNTTARTLQPDRGKTLVDD
ncbi:hypothetical protein J0X19_01965 [Hymenobacter sp. BT186]|uniref:Uncharacterized protein n=1 Tax=Hymenobacter telluris TaxID=2816474 RepID=A0A939ESH8_9BACT|nr:hypothetical protein [Hymenobacter telluris]MBO0356700.1 hypothetical protein [Hymenobacter telluris]MBW3372725.1 hypothetical protein [Hymenobacter norwichensis]